MQLSHAVPVRTAVFDEPNLVSHAGLVPGQSGGERVPPLVGCQVHGITVLVADVPERKPPVQRDAVAVVGHRSLPASVSGQRGEQVGVGVGPTGGDPGLLGPDLSLQFLVDRNRGLPVHLVV